MKRQIHDLVSSTSDGWSMVNKWFQEGKNTYEILKVNNDNAVNVLFNLQVTTNSPMGAIAYYSGGILVDDGWIRVLGSGHEHIFGNLLSWNGLDEGYFIDKFEGALIVSYDILGGAYAINAGLFGDDIKQVYYFAPDTLEWEQSHDSYSQFLQWLANGDLDEYYSNMRWRDWKKEVKVLKGDQGISVFPYLWTKQGKNVEESHREAIPMKEIWGIQHEIKNQFGK